MIKLKSLLKEGKSSDVVYVMDDYLWVSYSPGSGKTTPVRDLKKFITDKSGDSHFDSNAIDLVKWSKSNKAVLKNKISRIHKIPVYDRVSGHDKKQLSVWKDVGTFGDKIQPKGYIYMLIAQETNGTHVVNFFKTFNEAKNWLRQQANG